MCYFFERQERYYNYWYFQKIFDEYNRKPNNIWIDKATEFCNKLIKSWVHNNDTELYLTQNKGKSIVLNLKLMIM